MRRRIAAYLVLAAAAALSPSTARAEAWVLAPGEFTWDVRGSLFSADDFHGTSGDRATLTLGGLHEQRTLRLGGEVGWKKRVAFFAHAPIVSATRRLGDGGEWTDTGFGDLVTGLRLQLGARGASALALEASWKAPLGYSTALRVPRSYAADLEADLGAGLEPADRIHLVRNAAPPRFGDGQQDLQGLLWWGAALPGVSGVVELGGGYRARLDAPADQMLGRARLGLWLGGSLLVAGLYEGEIAAGDGDTPADEITQHLAGPLVVWRVDDGIDVFAGSLHTAAAENALHRDQFYAGLALRQSGLHRLQGLTGTTKRP
uniref:Transporter n=1 Tax=Eiseniibacteriota bacterium TaxID=2212470 RepID=A0A832I667_UNCEI